MSKKGQTYDRLITSTIAPLISSLYISSEQIKNSQKPYPDNLAAGGKKVFFSGGGNYLTYVDQNKKDIKRLNSLVNSVTANKNIIDSDITNKHFIDFVSKVNSLNDDVVKRNESFLKEFTRPINPTDKEGSEGEHIQLKETSVV